MKENFFEKKNNESIEKQASEKRLEYNDEHHLNELIKEILANKKQTGLEEFEEISLYIKKKMTKLSFQYYIPQYVPKKSIELTPYEEKIFSELNKKKPKQIETIHNYIEDVLELSKILEWGGISFSRSEWFKIRLGMKKLMLDSDATNVRFWGKIYGLQSDYYVIQGSLRHYPMQKPGTPYVDQRGNEGLNRFTFWVSNSVLEDWYELPEITPEQMVACRNFKYHLTGDLKSKVRAFSNFPGKEEHLLKCQILRILHSSYIVPEGFLDINNDYQDDLAGKITKYNEDYQPGTLDDMKSDDRWVHQYAYIFPNGKIIDSSQDQVEMLKKISDEVFTKNDKEGNPVEVKWWRTKVVGDQMQYNKENGNTASYAAVILNNTRWPGTAIVWKVKAFFINNL